MDIVSNNTNTVGSLTISRYTDRRAFEDMFPEIWHYPTTDGSSPISNAISESYTNILFPYRIEKVIFNDPATIVIWKDKTKTVVKVHGEAYDRGKGLAMCIAKKVLGGKFHSTFREWCGE